MMIFKHTYFILYVCVCVCMCIFFLRNFKPDIPVLKTSIQHHSSHTKYTYKT